MNTVRGSDRARERRNHPSTAQVLLTALSATVYLVRTNTTPTIFGTLNLTRYRRGRYSRVIPHDPPTAPHPLPTRSNSTSDSA